MSKVTNILVSIVILLVVLWSAIGSNFQWFNTCYEGDLHTKHLQFNGVTIYSTFENHKDNPFHK
ncbi:hypothetical protein SP6_6 [Salmonella phage SP6]|uniref:Uncharacterized protein n=2 Tax=Enterobacteria phage SP6 TaxID=2907955 RepID=Q6UGL1_BPSP6|nr:gp6 [Salmonella phage SP6]AAP48745.1 gp6 [Salmonella phage SP6]AAR89998.1 5 [Salmonella phage SP6] [Salmonella phage SP6]